jgi:hypothetical protein
MQLAARTDRSEAVAGHSNSRAVAAAVAVDGAVHPDDRAALIEGPSIDQLDYLAERPIAADAGHSSVLAPTGNAAIVAGEGVDGAG